MLSITTDYVRDKGDPKPYMREIAEAGFSHIHWCHHWNTDFLYSKYEISYIKKLLNEFSLHLLDLHASSGREKVWNSTSEHERLAGVELVKNRINMSGELDSDVIVMHACEYSDSLKRSLDELEPYAKKRNIRIAIENVQNGDFSVIGKIFNDYDNDFIGLCYDSGHGNITGDMGLDNLERFSDRLIAVHLHDNNGNADQHKPPFSGTVDWKRLSCLIAESAYEKVLSMEVSIRNTEIADEKDFLGHCYQVGNDLSKMVSEKQINTPDAQKPL